MKTLAIILLVAGIVVVRGQSFAVQKKTVHAPEMGLLEFLSIDYAGQGFSLVPPAGWRMEVELTERRVRFVTSNHGAAMSIVFSTNQAVLNNVSALLGLAPEIRASGNIEEFSVYSGDRQGKGVDTSFDVRGYTVHCRATAVPINNGAVHWVLTCDAKCMDSARQVFGAVLTSFQHTSRPEILP